MQQDLTPKQQTSEAIRQADTILITTGQHPSVDQVTAVLALSAVLRKFGKKVSVVISDSLPTQVHFLDSSMVSQSLSGLRDFIVKVDLKKAEVDKLRYEVQDGKLNVFITPFQGGFDQSDVSFDYGDYHFDLAIVLGVPTHARIDRVYADNQSLFNTIPVLNLDYHRSNENFGAVNLIESTASSLCEILVALSESLQTGLIDADIATIMLTGLISSTDRFTASHTTAKSMTVAAQLMAAGARQQSIIKGLYRDNRDSSDRQPAHSDQPARAERPARQDNRPAQHPRQSVPHHADVNPVEHQAIEQPTPSPIIMPNGPSPSMPNVLDSNIEHQSVEMFEPIIDPGHIELSVMDGNTSVLELPADELPAMADFAAAAQFLRRDIQNPDVRPQPQSEKPSEIAGDEADGQKGANPARDQS